MASEDQVRATKRRHSMALMQRPGVCGVGVEKDEMGKFFLAVHVDGSASIDDTTLPKSIDGCPVKLIQSGPFVKQ
jgi:hypothetical protein